MAASGQLADVAGGLIKTSPAELDRHRTPRPSPPRPGRGQQLRERREVAAASRSHPERCIHLDPDHVTARGEPYIRLARIEHDRVAVGGLDLVRAVAGEVDRGAVAGERPGRPVVEAPSGAAGEGIDGAAARLPEREDGLDVSPRPRQQALAGNAARPAAEQSGAPLVRGDQAAPTARPAGRFLKYEPGSPRRRSSGTPRAAGSLRHRP